MRRLRPWSVLVPFALLAIPPSAAAQDFDPHGRRHPAPHPQPHPGPAPGHPTGQPGAPRPNPANPAPPAGPADAVLIARYTSVLLAHPGDAFALQRLAQLYRQRDGNIQKLVADFEQRAAQAGAEQYGATVALAGLEKIDGRPDDAVKTYEKAVALKPDDATALLALARLHQDRGDGAQARSRYEQALKLQTAQADKEQTLRTLMQLALDGKDYDGARNFHAELAKLEPNNLFVKGELGRELFNRGEYERAEAEFKELVAAAAGDNRTLAPALRDLGRAQAKAHKNQEALATLKKALAAAGADSSVRAEVYGIITELYRADQQLPVLVKQLEDEHPSDFARLRLLGLLYEETGDSTKAIETFRRALALAPRDIDLRVKMIRLLQANGDLDKAIAEYEGLIRAAPNEPRFVFEECDALLQRGDRARALKLVSELEARANADEDTLNRVADFYGRIGESDRALKVLERLAQVSTDDPGHLVDLGDHYFQEGNRALAVQTWKRILVTIQPRAKALAALGDVYLEHDMVSDALAVYKEAVQLEPANLNYKKQLAAAYERTRSFHEALQLYAELAEKAKQAKDAGLAKECRTHIVTLWGLEGRGTLDQQVGPLSAKFSSNPPDVEAGRMLAEVELHLRKLPDTEATLRRVIQLAPGDTESYLALENVLRQENKFGDCIAVLEKLVEVEPKNARTIYRRMADYASSINRSDDAIKYAARAVELNPDDAEGHKKLAEMYAARQDAERAIGEYRLAIQKNDRLWSVYFDLAGMLHAKGQDEEADRLYRRVVRGSPDEELIARAARLSMQLNTEKGTLESLEQDLLPLAIGNPQRPMYRHILVEIYGQMTFALTQHVKHGTGKEADDARAALARIGARAVKPLLDALADSDVSQQRIAIDVLGYVENKNAALPLFSFATGPADTALRVRAMISCGRLRDPALVPRYEALLFPKEDGGDDASDALAAAATWGLARMGDPKALPVLRRAARTGSPAQRALAVLGLGLAHDKGATVDVAQMARAVDSGNVARAAAAYALGELGAEGETPTLLTLAQGTDSLPRQMALVALARMSAARGKPDAEPVGGRAALDAMADAVFAAGDPESPRAQMSAESLQRAGSAALVLLSGAGKDRAAAATLPLPEGSVDVEMMLGALVPRDFSDTDRAAALVRFAVPLGRAALAALETSGERARAVLDAFGTGDGELEPFVGPAGAPEAPAVGAARAKAREIARKLEPSIIPLVRHPEAAIRTKALVLLAQSPSDAAADALVQGVDDPSEPVQRVALAAIGKHPNDRAVAAVSKLLASDANWAMRVLAAEAMGRLGGAARAAKSGDLGAAAAARLREAATRDSYALVREAALEALAAFDPTGGRELARAMASSDAEPRVRQAAEAIARQP